jgi:Fe(3+) dicitrate transport protein
MSISAFAETGILTGKVFFLASQKPVEGAIVSITKLKIQTRTNSNGEYRVENIQYGSYEIEIFYENMQRVIQNVIINKPINFYNAELVQISKSLAEVKVVSESQQTSGIGRLNSVDGFGIYEAKKTEVIFLKDVNANLASNNPRQVFGKIPGLNIWESDAAGLQMGIGGRGLSPNRTSNFNTRQNGYDISADALGYPESYYTPPMEAIEKIEIVRGAAGLQYGTQFGGMINFVFKQGAKNKPIELVSRQTLGSYGFFGSFNSIGGTVAKGKINYFTFFNHKQSNGWRPNSGFNMNTIYGSVKYDITQRMQLIADYTFMKYDAQQPGGMTDAQFQIDPRKSYRARNWFSVNWNLFALTFNYQFSENTKINIRNFGLLSYRNSLGNLERINVVDLGGERTLIISDFANIGNETRLLHQYRFLKQPATALIGTRMYKGTTRSRQGNGSSGSDADYTFNNPNNLEGSDYYFDNTNAAIFAENIFRTSKKISFTPGIRFEYINTSSSGYYKIQTKDFAGNIIADTNIWGSQQNDRKFLLAGLGISYKHNQYVEVYGNISQNYRAVNFNDLRVVNPNSKVDENMKDESGFSADIGTRGRYKHYISFDATIFLLSYNDRIGQILKADQPPLYQDYRFRTNIADSRNFGFEVFAETDLWKSFTSASSSNSLILFTNFAIVDAIYINAEDKAIENNKVEMASPIMFRAGISFRRKQFGITAQGNYVTEHYTDATNAIRVAGAVNGVIPTYKVIDITASYTHKMVSIDFSCNNLLNNMYFTRRADSYPGPGIIPSDGISFFLTLGIKI